MEIRILYDNEAEEGYKKGWGFSCLVGNHLLFDVGANADTLLYNMRRANVDIEAIDKVFLSHAHADHVGGINILNYLGPVRVIIPNSFSSAFMQGLIEYDNVTPVKIKKLEKIDEGLYSTGELGSIVKEQSLIVKTENRLVLVVGCSHPGVDIILKEAQKQGVVKGIIGGFHDFSRIDELYGLEIISPCHCTSFKNEIKLLYPLAHRDCRTGSIIHV